MFLMLARTFPETLSFPFTACGHDHPRHTCVRGDLITHAHLENVTWHHIFCIDAYGVGRDVERLQSCTWYPSNQSLPHMEQPQKPGFSRPFTHRPLEMIPNHPIQSQGAPWDAMFAPYHSGVGNFPQFKVGYNGYNQHVPVTKSVALDGYRDELLQEGKLLYLKGSNGVAWNLAPPSSPPSYY